MSHKRAVHISRGRDIVFVRKKETERKTGNGRFVSLMANPSTSVAADVADRYAKSRIRAAHNIVLRDVAVEQDE